MSEKLFFHCIMARILYFLMDSALLLVTQKAIPLGQPSSSAISD